MLPVIEVIAEDPREKGAHGPPGYCLVGSSAVVSVVVRVGAHHHHHSTDSKIKGEPRASQLDPNRFSILPLFLVGFRVDCFTTTNLGAFQKGRSGGSSYHIDIRMTINPKKPEAPDL